MGPKLAVTRTTTLRLTSISDAQGRTIYISALTYRYFGWSAFAHLHEFNR